MNNQKTGWRVLEKRATRWRPMLNPCPLLAAVLCIGLCAFAQQDVAAAAPQTAPTARQDTRETEEQTIARCIKDLKSTDVALRRKAALLLGKYPGHNVDLALIDCLKDDDAQIRLGALVSLHEDRNLPHEASPHILRLLSDPDIHVRRLASSLAGEALLGSGYRTRTIAAPEPQKNTEENEQEKRQNGEKLIIGALEDKDYSIRRNILTVCLSYGINVPHEKLFPSMTDPEQEIRFLALRLFRRNYPSFQQLEQLAILINDTSPTIRREFCLLCADFGKRSEPFFRQLLDDSDTSVRILAAKQLLIFHAEGCIPLAMKLLEDNAIPAEQRVQLVQPLACFKPDVARTHLQKLAESQSPVLAAAALRILAQDLNLIKDADFFIPFANAPEKAVSQAALIAIRRRLSVITPENLAALMASNNHDAKAMALSFATMRLPRDQAAQFFLDACLESDVTLRITALKQLWHLRPDGWMDILIASLEDENQDIQRIAALELLRFRTLPEPNGALRKFEATCRDPQLKNRIRNVLGKPQNLK